MAGGGSRASISPPSQPIPNAGGSVYASSNQNLWQSTDGGATWPNPVPIPGIATEVDVAPTNSNNVVVTVGGRVLVSTDALVPGGLTLNDITRNLPGRFVGGRRLRSQRSGDHLRGARRVQRFARRARLPDLAHGGNAGRISLRRSTSRSTPSRSMAARRPLPCTPGRTSACCAPSTAARTGCARRHPLPGRAGVRIGVSPGRVAGRDVRPGRLLLRQSRPVRRSQ